MSIAVGDEKKPPATKPTTDTYDEKTTESDTNQYYSPSAYCYDMSAKLNFYFTIEYQPWSDPFVHTDQVLDPKIASVEDLVKELQLKVPAGRVILDRSDRGHPVIHLIDNALAKRSAWLDRKINLKFSGAVGDLPAEIQKHGVSEIGVGSISTGALFFTTNRKTKIDIDVKEQPVRDILTHCMDLEECSPLIWEAKTIQLTDGSWKTLVWYAPPKGDL